MSIDTGHREFYSEKARPISRGLPELRSPGSRPERPAGGFAGLRGPTNALVKAVGFGLP